MVILIKHSRDIPEALECFPAVRGGRCMVVGGDIDRDALDAAGLSHYVPVVPPELEERFLREYIELVDILGGWNGDRRLWWATDVASKNRVYSPLFPLLKDFCLCLASARTADEDGKTLVVVGAPDSFLEPLRSVLGVVESVGYDTSRVARWKRYATGRLVQLRGLLGGLRVALRRCREAWKVFPRERLRGLGGRPVYLIKSFAYSSSFSDGGDFDDPFFKELSPFLERMLPGHWQVQTVTMSFEGEAAQYRKMAGLGQPVTPAEAWLRPRDLLGGALVLLGGVLRPFRVAGNLEFLSADVTELVRDTLNSGGGRITPLHYLYFPLGRRLAEDLDLRACVLTFEGNPWENMFVRGIRKSGGHVPTLGVQHAVLIKEAAGVFKGCREVRTGCLPDRILTTGEVPASILRTYGQVPSDRIEPACALRYGYLYREEVADRDFDPASVEVLVVLEGLPGADGLVRYVLRESGACAGVRFRIRAHPVRPLDVILRGLGESLADYSNVEASTGGSVSDDVEESDVVMYWGTTVALEALMMRRPLIHYDAGGVLNCDPLFGFDEFKWVVRGGTSLRETLAELANVMEKDRDRRVRAGTEYIGGYFNKVNDETLQPYVRGIAAG